MDFDDSQVTPIAVTQPEWRDPVEELIAAQPQARKRRQQKKLSKAEQRKIEDLTNMFYGGVALAVVGIAASAVMFAAALQYGGYYVVFTGVVVLGLRIASNADNAIQEIRAPGTKSRWPLMVLGVFLLIVIPLFIWAAFIL